MFWSLTQVLTKSDAGIVGHIVLAANKQGVIYPPQRENALLLADTRNCVNNTLVVPPFFWG